MLGETLDMGLGNLFDVFARESGMEIPHGSQVAKLSEHGSYFPLPYTVKGMNFAFTGLLSSAVREVGKKKTEDICRSLMETSFAEICEAAERALREIGVNGDLRVRYYGESARVEMNPAELERWRTPGGRAAVHAAVTEAGFETEAAADPALPAGQRPERFVLRPRIHSRTVGSDACEEPPA